MHSLPEQTVPGNAAQSAVTAHFGANRHLLSAVLHVSPSPSHPHVVTHALPTHCCPPSQSSVVAHVAGSVPNAVIIASAVTVFSRVASRPDVCIAHASSSFWFAASWRSAAVHVADTFAMTPGLLPAASIAARARAPLCRPSTSAATCASSVWAALAFAVSALVCVLIAVSRTPKSASDRRLLRARISAARGSNPCWTARSNVPVAAAVFAASAPNHAWSCARLAASTALVGAVRAVANPGRVRLPKSVFAATAAEASDAHGYPPRVFAYVISLVAILPRSATIEFVSLTHCPVVTVGSVMRSVPGRGGGGVDSAAESALASA